MILTNTVYVLIVIVRLSTGGQLFGSHPMPDLDTCQEAREEMTEAFIKDPNTGSLAAACIAIKPKIVPHA